MKKRSLSELERQVCEIFSRLESGSQEVVFQELFHVFDANTQKKLLRLCLSEQKPEQLTSQEIAYRKVVTQLSNLLTTEMRQEILSFVGVSSAKAMDLGQKGNDAFFLELLERGKFTPTNMNSNIFGNFKAMKDIIDNRR